VFQLLELLLDFHQPLFKVGETVLPMAIGNRPPPCNCRPDGSEACLGRHLFLVDLVERVGQAREFSQNAVFIPLHGDDIRFPAKSVKCLTLFGDFLLQFDELLIDLQCR